MWMYVCARAVWMFVYVFLCESGYMCLVLCMFAYFAWLKTKMSQSLFHLCVHISYFYYSLFSWKVVLSDGVYHDSKAILHTGVWMKFLASFK